MKNKLKNLLDEMIQKQELRLRNIGEQIIDNLTSEDLLQPMDYPELEQSPEFRFEEGVLMGMGEMKAAILALITEKDD